MRIELLSYDEYGSSSIVMSADSVEKALDAATQFVTKTNCENALAQTEREKQWEAYFPVIMKRNKVSTDMLYAGNKKDGKHRVWVKGKKGYTLEEMPKDVTIRHLLGEVNTAKGKEKITTQWLLKDHKGNFIEGLKSPELDAKTILFVKISG